MINTAIRSRGIGGSEIAAIVGMDPRRDRFSVYAEKLGLVERAEPSPRMKWGKRIERIIAEAYAEETNQDVRWCDETTANPARPWQVMTPDALVWRRNPVGGVDAKNVAWDQSHEWEDGPPDRIALQGQWYMSASGLPWWDIAALFGGYDLRTFRLHFDPEIESVLLSEAENFWKIHVLPQNAPPIGCSETAAEYLRQRFPRHVEALRAATSEEFTLAEKLKAVRQQFSTAKAEKAATENALKELIAESEGISIGSDKITWKRCKDTTGTDWRAIAGALALRLENDEEAARYEIDELEKQHQIITRKGVRRLIVPRSWGEED